MESAFPLSPASDFPNNISIVNRDAQPGTTRRSSRAGEGRFRRFSSPTRMNRGFPGSEGRILLLRENDFRLQVCLNRAVAARIRRIVGGKTYPDLHP